MSNFIHIPTEFRGVMSDAIHAEQLVYTYPVLAGVSIRRCLESWVYWVYEHDRIPIPYDKNMVNLLAQPEFQELFSPEILQRMHLLRKVGNTGSHSQFHGSNLKTEEVLHALKLLHGLSYYLMDLYSRETVLTPTFSEENIPPSTD